MRTLNIVVFTFLLLNFQIVLSFIIKYAQKIVKLTNMLSKPQSLNMQKYTL